MFISLVVHGLQAVVISHNFQEVMENHPILVSGIGATVGGIIIVVGYTFGKILTYSSLEYVIHKLSCEIAKSVIDAIFGTVLCLKCGLYKIYLKFI